ncbi:MAG: hypothetical protein O6941_08515, partial [Planctomycetota bacterium]|nr:hypothetical protein [Planctomycetota bacterium]
MGLHRRAVDVRDIGPAAGFDSGGDRVHHTIHTLLGVALVGQVQPEIVDVLGDRAFGVGREAFLSRVDQSLAAGAGLIVQLAGQTLGRGLVGEGEFRPAPIAFVIPRDRPSGVAAVAVFRSFEHAGHKSPTFRSSASAGRD